MKINLVDLPKMEVFDEDLKKAINESVEYWGEHNPDQLDILKDSVAGILERNLSTDDEIDWHKEADEILSGYLKEHFVLRDNYSRSDNPNRDYDDYSYEGDGKELDYLDELAIWWAIADEVMPTIDSNELDDTLYSLFDGGWRPTDLDAMKVEYGFSNDEMDYIADRFQEICEDICGVDTYAIDFENFNPDDLTAKQIHQLKEAKIEKLKEVRPEIDWENIIDQIDEFYGFEE